MRTTIITVALAVASLAPAAPAIAGKGNTQSSISVVVLTQSFAAEATSMPNQGDQVTFDVQTAATDRPYVLLNCYQGGTWVYTAQGFHTALSSFTLASSAWSSGAADCTARLGALNADGTRFRELASTTFHVDA